MHTLDCCAKLKKCTLPVCPSSANDNIEGRRDEEGDYLLLNVLRVIPVVSLLPHEIYACNM